MVERERINKSPAMISLHTYLFTVYLVLVSFPFTLSIYEHNLVIVASVFLFFIVFCFSCLFTFHFFNSNLSSSLCIYLGLFYNFFVREFSI